MEKVLEVTGMGSILGLSLNILVSVSSLFSASSLLLSHMHGGFFLPLPKYFSFPHFFTWVYFLLCLLSPGMSVSQVVFPVKPLKCILYFHLVITCVSLS